MTSYETLTQDRGCCVMLVPAVSHSPPQRLGRGTFWRRGRTSQNSKPPRRIVVVTSDIFQSFHPNSPLCIECAITNSVQTPCKDRNGRGIAGSSKSILEATRPLLPTVDSIVDIDATALKFRTF